LLDESSAQIGGFIGNLEASKASNQDEIKPAVGGVADQRQFLKESGHRYRAFAGG